jgi:hypothetical protein
MNAWNKALVLFNSLPNKDSVFLSMIHNNLRAPAQREMR